MPHVIAELYWDARKVAESAPLPGSYTEFDLRPDVDFCLDKEILDLWGDGRIFAEATRLTIRFVQC